MMEQELEKYSQYQGLTPMPEDFDVFWDQRIAEADAQPLVYEICPSEIPDSPTGTFRYLWYQGMGGAKLCAKYLKPKGSAPVPLVLQFHGYPGASRSWLEQASFLGMGCAVLALDCPGQGGLGQDLGGYQGTTVSGHLVAGLDGPAQEMYYVRLHQNIRILCRIVQQLEGIDCSRVFVNGASQGGALGLACCALNPELIRRAAILYPFLSDFRMIWEQNADLIPYEGLRYYARWFDPDGAKEDQWFLKLGYIDSKNFAHRIQCPVLFGTGMEDAWVLPVTQCAVYNALRCQKKRYLYPGMGHEEIADFDDLLLNFFGAEEVQW